MPTDDVEVESLTEEEGLWRLVSALTDCQTGLDVVAAVAKEGAAAVGAAAANVVLLNGPASTGPLPSGQAAVTLSAPGGPIDLADPVPVCDAVRSGLPVLLSSPDEIAGRYPALLGDFRRLGLEAHASEPLSSAHGEALGAIGFGWSAPQPFSTRQVRRLDLIAQLTGLALQRCLAVPDPTNGRPTAVLESMPNALLSMDSRFTVTYVNAEGERLLKADRHQLVGHNLFEVFPEAADSQFESQYRKALSSGKAVTFEEYFAPLETWFEIHAWPDQQGLNLYFADIGHRRHVEIQRSAALDEAMRENARLSLLTEINARVAGAVTLPDIFDRVSRTIVAHVSDWCTIVVPSDGQELVRVAAAHRSAVLDELAKRLVGSYPHAFDGPSPGVVVYKSGQPLRLERLAHQIVEDLDNSVASAAYGRTLHMMGDGPGLIMPVRSQGEVVAVITMVRAGGQAFSDADVELLTEVANCVAVLLEDAQKIEMQRQTAAALQAAALPKSLPRPPGLVLAAGYRAASEGSQVGGDWYDAFELQNGCVALVVGDAAGHGLQAAAFMTQIRNVLRGHLFASLGPAEALSRLSELTAVQEPDSFATIICLEVDARDGSVTWASAGHPAPILLQADGASTYLAGEPGPPIGCAGPHAFGAPGEHRFKLAPQDRLIMFTDGLVERRSGDLDIGLTHLMLTAEETRESPSADRACEMILERMLPARHEDDVCLLIADFPGRALK